MWTEIVRAHPQRLAPTLGEQLGAHAAAGPQLGLDGSGPHLVAGPLYHAAPFLLALYDLYNGATVNLLPRFDALAALQAVERLGIAHTHFVPTHHGLPPEVHSDADLLR